MAKSQQKPDYIFETSWEVCNKVGGIYTVLTSRAKTLVESYGNQLIFIGPDLWKDKVNPDFKEDSRLLKAWKNAAKDKNINVRIGRWQVEGNPVAVLVDFAPFFATKNDIYAEAWTRFGVDSIKAYGDYDEASMFSYAAGKFVEAVYLDQIHKNKKVVYQAHEWMSGLGMLFLKEAAPSIATIFTTHATSIGRSIAGNNKLLYKYFNGYNGDQMAAELNMDAKHSIEKQSAHRADCFTTVSTFTDRECKQLLEKSADVVLPNGFDSTIVPKGRLFTTKRAAARKQILRVASALLGEKLSDKTFIVSTSGRNDYRCKGFDVYLEALAQLSGRMQNEGLSGQKVLALVEVPCWVKQPREDILNRLSGTDNSLGLLPQPFLTHELYNFNEDRIVNTIRGLALWNEINDPVKVMLVPCYLDGADGVVDMEYYDALTANDLCIYPSYYEPWGYTPLEACAFRTPCITTDLSGFGQWVNNTLGRTGRIEDGVKVIHRDDNNYFEVAAEIAETILNLLNSTAANRKKVRNNAAALAEKAQWSNFIKYYYEAYDKALSNTNNKK